MDSLEIHLVINGEKSGPHTLSEIEAMLSSGKISGRTLAWKAGLEQWVPLAELVPNLDALGAGVRPPVLPQEPLIDSNSGVPNPNGVPNHLVAAILVTILCCIPFGIVSIVFASQVNPKLASGDLSGAQEASRKAAMWAWISFGAGLVVIVLSLAFGVIGGMAEGLEP